MFQRKAFSWRTTGEEEANNGRQIDQLLLQAGKGAGRERPGSNPQTFPWNRGSASPTEAPNRTTVPGGSADTAASTRLYEVVHYVCPVRAEPHLQAKLKTKKSRGARTICCEVTVNGWLKLASEPGWMLTDMRGLDGVEEVSRPIDDNPISLAVPEYHPQGMCCLEVVTKAGVTVQAEADSSATAVTTRRLGEYVFARSQNFEGWLRLSGEEGWVEVAPPNGGPPALRPRRCPKVDIFALCDLWASARRVRKAGLKARDIEVLKNIERRTLHAANLSFERCCEAGNADDLVASGVLKEEDLLVSTAWVRQRIFASLLVQASQEDSQCAELAPGFKLSERALPLPPRRDEDGQEEEEPDDDDEDEFGQSSIGRGGDGSGTAPFTHGGKNYRIDANGVLYDPHSGEVVGMWNHMSQTVDPPPDGGMGENTTDFEYRGKTYQMTPEGALYDPPNGVPIGMWNQDTKVIEPALVSPPGSAEMMLCYMGKSYILMPDDGVVNPETEEVVGIFNRMTTQIDFIDPVSTSSFGGSEYAGAADVGGGKPDAGNQSREHVEDLRGYMLKAESLRDSGRLEDAAGLYGQALELCREARVVDVSDEVDIVRKRAACWSGLKDYRALLEDAEFLLAQFSADEEAREWKKKAQKYLAGGTKAAAGPADDKRPGCVDYSKFEDIDSSDGEQASKPKAAPTEAALDSGGGAAAAGSAAGGAGKWSGYDFPSKPKVDPPPAGVPKAGGFSSYAGAGGAAGGAGDGGYVKAPPQAPPAASAQAPPQRQAPLQRPKSPERPEAVRCAYCNGLEQNPSLCTRCRVTYYCGRECQRLDWSNHKKVCGKQQQAPAPQPTRPSVASPAAAADDDDDDDLGMEELD